MERSQLSSVVRIRCFICQKISREVKTNERRQRTGFIMLLRYLEVDVEQFSKTDLSRLPMCANCSCRLECFWELYEEFESVRLYLDEDVKALQEIMEGDKRTCPRGQKNMSGGKGNAEKRTLREVIIQKCTRKLEQLPMVKLRGKLKDFDLIDFNPGNDDSYIRNMDQLEDKDSPNNNINENDNFTDEAFPHFSGTLGINVDEFENEGSMDAMDGETSDSFEEKLPADSEIEGPFSKQTKSSDKTTSSPEKEEQITDQDNPTKSYKCFCHREFKEYRNFSNHQKLIHNIQVQDVAPIKILYKCNYCPKLQPSLSKKRLHMVRLHLMQFHGKIIPPGVTQKTLKATAAVLAERHKVYNPKKLGCPYCPKIVTPSRFIKDHIQDKHFDKILVYLKNPQDSSLEPVQLEHKKCPRVRRIPQQKTSATLNTQLKLKKKRFQNKSKPSQGERGPLHCDYCESSFCQNNNLVHHTYRKHALSYLKDKLPPNSTQLQLEESIRVITEQGETRPGNRTTCSICKQVHLQRGDLRIHILYKHLPSVMEIMKEIPVPQEVEKDSFWCSICRIKFNSQEIFQDHMKFHPEDAFPCKYCSKSFRSNLQERGHCKAVHGFQYLENQLPPGTTEKEYKAAVDVVLSKSKKVEENGCAWFCCPYCEKTFMRMYFVKKHVLSIHILNVIEVLLR